MSERGIIGVNTTPATRVPEQHTRENTHTPLREDIRTSELTPRLAEDGDHVREYSPVLHDQPLRETKAVGSDGRAFGTNVLPEAISVSPKQARGWLQLLYGQDVADSMIGRAAITGKMVNGELVRVKDSQASTKGKLSVTTDKSRPGMFVLVPHVLRQSGARRK